MSRPKSGGTLYERVVKELKSQILSGVYPKGAALPPEKELIDAMGVSRITIRKALGILADMGLIQTSQGRKSVVIFDAERLADDQSLSRHAQEYVRNFRAVQQIRLMIEPEIAREVAITATDEEIARLEDCLSHRQRPQGGEPPADFHRTLIMLLNNEELLHIYDNLLILEEGSAPAGITSPDRQEAISAQMEEQHHRILNAIRSHDGEFAYFYMKEHMRFVAEIYEKHFTYLF